MKQKLIKTSLAKPLRARQHGGCGSGGRYLLSYLRDIRTRPVRQLATPLSPGHNPPHIPSMMSHFPPHFDAKITGLNGSNEDLVWASLEELPPPLGPMLPGYESMTVKMKGVSWASQGYPLKFTFHTFMGPVYQSPFVHQGGAVVQVFRDFQPLTLQRTRASMDRITNHGVGYRSIGTAKNALEFLALILCRVQGR